jgi:uncharacterized protein (DUF433 family)
LEKFTRNREIQGGKPVIAGTRILVKAIKNFWKAGYSIDQIREQYPVLTTEDIRAALGHASRGNRGEGR